MGEVIGYARVSTASQSLAAQIAALEAAGCTKIFDEKASGASGERSALPRLLDYVRAGDVVVVTRLDRLARSVKELLIITEALAKTGANLRSLAEPWADTTSPAGKMVMTVMGGIAEFERQLIIERTATGRQAALENGIRFGRKPALTREQIEAARSLIAQGEPVSKVARMFGVARSTIYKTLTDNPYTR